MKAQNLKSIFILLLFSSIIFTNSVSATFTGIGILNSEINSDTINLENIDTVQINNSIVNYDNYIHAELIINYKLINQKDGSEIINENRILSFGAYEVKDISKELKIPNTIPTGEYIINIFVNGPNNIPLAGFNHKIQINNKDIINPLTIVKGPYLKIPFVSDSGTITYIESYGTTGSNVLQGSTYYLKFNLKNENSNYNDLKAIINIIPTLGDSPLKTIEYKLNPYTSATQIDDYEIEMTFNTPGTYRITLSFYNGDSFLFQKEVRLVITGEGGSILHVKNKQDTYNIGDTISIYTDLVGPADGATKLKDIYLKLILSEDNKIIKVIIKDIPSLEFKTMTETISFISEWNLEKYKIQMILGKDDVIYDEITINYEPIIVKKMITPDGRIYSPGLGGCFDNNICTTEERQSGNCYDCYLEDNPRSEPTETNNNYENNEISEETQTDNNNYKDSIKIIIIFIIVISLSIYIIYKIWGNQK